MAAGGVIVPNRYALHLNPADFAGFASYRTALEDDLAHGVMARARHERYTLVARPRVEIVADPATRRGEIRVAANVVDEHGDAPRDADRAPAGVADDGARTERRRDPGFGPTGRSSW